MQLLQDIATYLTQNGWQTLIDILDIAIVAFVIYKIILLISETRAEQLIRGIFFLLVATQLSEWLHFNTINFILKNAMQVGVLAVIIVFQPELRRALEQVGRSRFSRFFNFETSGEDSAEHTVSEIRNAVNALSQSKTGALMVVERTTKVGDIIRTGISMDSKISAELLCNLFVPNTPLHDGAVIIRGDRIQAAACFLPLTKNNNLSSELGTRHRAAIGMSEESDAIVIVVSEETGKISLALNGNLTRNLTPETLERAVLRFLVENQDKENTLVKKIKKWKEKSR